MKIKCKTCGQEFPIEGFYSYVRKSTGREERTPDCRECAKKKRKEYLQIKIQRPKGYSKAKKRAETNQKAIDEINNEALRHGMSYGKWVALQEMRKEKK